MKKILTLAGIVILLIAACSPLAQEGDPNADSNFISTQSAMTIEALSTQFASTLMAPTQTAEPVLIQTEVSVQTSIPPVTTTPLPPATPTQVTYCDWVAFVKDVSIPDGTVWIQGTSLTKTWRLKNRGSCTWTPDYSLAFSHGDQMEASASLRLPGYVLPGETIDISVDLKAPNTPGHYVGHWMLKNPSGVLFGYGDQANKPFFIDLHSGNQQSGSVTGKVCFPGERIPPLTIYIQKINSSQIITVPVTWDQVEYQAALEPGLYTAYAWTTGFEIGGAYTHNDHSLKPFEVKRGMTAENVDICDWYGGPGSVPYPPAYQTGTISGHLSYPSESIPPLRVVAVNTQNGAPYWVNTLQNQQSYEIKGLPLGEYTVVAYARGYGMAGGYTNHVTCVSAPCNDHNLVSVHLDDGTSAVNNVDPFDWYAPAGTFPPDPTQ